MLYQEDIADDIAQCLVTMKRMGVQNVIDCCVVPGVTPGVMHRLVLGALHFDIGRWMQSLPIGEYSMDPPEQHGPMDLYRLPVLSLVPQNVDSPVTDANISDLLQVIGAPARSNRIKKSGTKKVLKKKIGTRTKNKKPSEKK